MQIKSAPRRRHAAELKARVLAACDEPGASVAAIARAHDLNANLVHKWRRGAAPLARPPSSSRAGHVAGEFIALALPSREAVPAAPADIRIVRCNREGLLPGKGHVEVFVRKVPAPLSGLRNGGQATRSTLGDARPVALRPEHFNTYFSNYYDGFASRDARGIVEDLLNRGDMAMKFRTAAKNFRLIDDEDQVSLIVPYASASPTAREVAPLIARLRAGDSDRGLLRGLQRFIVQVRQRAADTWQQRRDIEEVLPGLFILNNALLYDHGLGLLRDGRPLSAKSLVQ